MSCLVIFGPYLLLKNNSLTPISIAPAKNRGSTELEKVSNKFVDTIRIKTYKNISGCELRPRRRRGRLANEPPAWPRSANGTRIELTRRRRSERVNEIGLASRQVSSPIRLCSSIIVAFLMFVSLLDDLSGFGPGLGSEPFRLLGRVAGASPAGAGQQSAVAASMLEAGNKQAAANAKPASLQLATKQADVSVASFPQASSREIEKQIVDKILGEGYDKRIRPAGSGPYNASRPGK